MVPILPQTGPLTASWLPKPRTKKQPNAKNRKTRHLAEGPRTENTLGELARRKDYHQISSHELFVSSQLFPSKASTVSTSSVVLLEPPMASSVPWKTLAAKW